MHIARIVGALLAVAVGQGALASQPSRTRASGIALGPYAAGFEIRTGLDRTRPVAPNGGGMRMGLAIWYPARPGSAGTAMTSLDYRLLPHGEVSAAERTRLIGGEVEPLLASPHVGIVPQSRTQALDGISSGGIAVRGAPHADARFPVVMLFGGPYYLATTAETLATRGFVVCAPFRFAGQSNESGWEFPRYMENSVRDGEWALEQLQQVASVDGSRIGALGHGGGGLQALLFAMRNARVTALANIDAGNFSTRTEASKISLYKPRLQRSPYLYIATPGTRKGQDLFSDFLAMSASDRYEVILQEPAVRHHDLSDLGRAVTEPLQIRGEPQAAVQQAFVAVQDLLAHFFDSQLRREPESRDALAAWMEHRSSLSYRVELHRANHGK